MPIPTFEVPMSDGSDWTCRKCKASLGAVFLETGVSIYVGTHCASRIRCIGLTRYFICAVVENDCTKHGHC
jgi:hypothetical protein